MREIKREEQTYSLPHALPGAADKHKHHSSLSSRLATHGMAEQHPTRYYKTKGEKRELQKGGWRGRERTVMNQVCAWGDRGNRWKVVVFCKAPHCPSCKSREELWRNSYVLDPMKFYGASFYDGNNTFGDGMWGAQASDSPNSWWTIFMLLKVYWFLLFRVCYGKVAVMLIAYTFLPGFCSSDHSE